MSVQVSPFDFVNDISYNKNYIFDDKTEKEYLPFIVNRQFSYFIDCIFPLNELNRFPSLDKKMQHDFLFHYIRRAKRFSKWAKKEKNDDVEVIKLCYNVSENKAYEILAILTPEELHSIKYNKEEENEV